MKLFSWAHRKLHQNPTYEKRQHNEHADVLIIASTLEPLPSHGSRFDTKRKDQGCSTPMRSVTDSSQVERSFRDQKFLDDKLQTLSALTDRNRALLTIGTLGARDLQLRGEERHEVQKYNASSDPDVSPRDLLKLQEELQRILYTTDGGQFENYVQASSEIEDLKNDKSHGNQDEQAGKKVFPLQKFLEVPLVELPPVHVVNKKKHVLVQGLSNLFSCAAIPEKRLHHKAKETVKSIRISPFFLEKLMKFKGRGPGQRSKLEKFLQIVRKIGMLQHNNKVDYKEADGRCMLMGKAETPGCSHDGDVGDVDEDVRALKECWINTDDEYLELVLEL